MPPRLILNKIQRPNFISLEQPLILLFKPVFGSGKLGLYIGFVIASQAFTSIGNF